MQYINETNEIILCKNDYVRMGLDYYKFIGSVDKISEVPISNCLYKYILIIDNYLELYSI